MPVARLVRAVLAAALLTATAGCATGTAAQSRTGLVSGVVLSAPSCPVEQAGSPCPPRPATGAEVTARRGGTTVAHVRADGDGRFSLRLAAGTYTIVARATGGIGSTARAEVAVPADGAATVTLTVDSGIR